MGRGKRKSQDHVFSESSSQRIRYLRANQQCIIKSDPILKELLDIVQYQYRNLHVGDYRILQELMNHSFGAVQEAFDSCRCSVHLMIDWDWNVPRTTASAARRNNEPDVQYGHMRSEAMDKLKRLSNVGQQRYFMLLNHSCGEYLDPRLLSPIPNSWEEQIIWWAGRYEHGNNGQRIQPHFNNRGDALGEPYAIQNPSHSRMAYNHQQPHQPQGSWVDQGPYQDHGNSPYTPPTRPAKVPRLMQPPSPNMSVNSNKEDYNGSDKTRCTDCSKSVLEENYQAHRKSASCQNKQKQKEKAQARKVQGIDTQAHQNGVTIDVVPPNADQSDKIIEKPGEVKDQNVKSTARRRKKGEKRDQAMSSGENESRKSQQKESHSSKNTGDEGASTQDTMASVGDHVRTQSEQENVNVEQQPRGSSTQEELKDDEGTNLGKGTTDDEKEATDTINAIETAIEDGEID